MKRLGVIAAAIITTLSLALPAGASINTNPPASDGFQNTCVITHKVILSGQGIELKMSIGGTYDPDGGLGPFSCTSQVALHGTGGWTAWMNGPATTTSAAMPLVLSQNFGPTGAGVLDAWAVRLLNIGNGLGQFRCFHDTWGGWGWC
jgi:hypothetical protein